MDNLIVIGDSWAKGYNEETGKDGDGWAQILGVPEKNILAVSGSRAYDWHQNINLVKTVDEGDLTGKVFVISLLGNDLREIAEDGKIEAHELAGFSFTVDGLNALVTEWSKRGARLLFLLYKNPYPENPVARLAVNMINQVIMGSFRRLDPAKNEFLNLEILLEPEHLTGFHPNTAGYKVIADAVKDIYSALSSEPDNA